jgi:hypothetical protein
MLPPRWQGIPLATSSCASVLHVEQGRVREIALVVTAEHEAHVQPGELLERRAELSLLPQVGRRDLRSVPREEPRDGRPAMERAEAHHGDGASPEIGPAGAVERNRSGHCGSSAGLGAGFCGASTGRGPVGSASRRLSARCSTASRSGIVTVPLSGTSSIFTS